MNCMKHGLTTSIVDLVAIINQLPINCWLGHDIWLTLSLVIYFGKNWPLPFLKKQFSILPSIPNQLGKCPSFETRFSQNQVKPYSGIFKEPIVTF